MKPETIASLTVKVELTSQSEQIKNINIRSVIVEIKHAIEEFHKTGQEHIIDLLNLPLASYERERLLDLLGQGELFIQLSALGKSEIYETLFSGVWLIKHYDQQGIINGLFIEICEVPEIVLSKIEDLPHLSEQLQELIDDL
ncbi:MAG: hydrogenase expression/formation C-terminal domain-containing protein [Pseudomonadota bacterium]